MFAGRISDAGEEFRRPPSGKYGMATDKKMPGRFAQSQANESQGENLQ
jgi:hypothetical protein